MNDATIDHFAKMVQDFGFPVIAAIGLGYFVFYVWKWVTKDISPTIGESKKTLIGLIDKVRMLDNDMIRLNIKLKTLRSIFCSRVSIQCCRARLCLTIWIVITTLCIRCSTTRFRFE